MTDAEQTNENQVWYVTHKSLAYFEAVRITPSQVEELKTIEQEREVLNKTAKEYRRRCTNLFDNKVYEAYALKQLPEVPVEHVGVIDRIPEGYRAKEVREDSSVHEMAYIREAGMSLDEVVGDEVLAVRLQDHSDQGYFEVVRFSRKDIEEIKRLDMQEFKLRQRYDLLNSREREILSNPQTFFLDQKVVLVQDDLYLERIPEGYVRVKRKGDEQ